MRRILILLLILSSTAFAGNGIERGSYRIENPIAKIPEDILEMIELAVIKRCDTSRLSFIGVESVEVQKNGFDQNGSDVRYTVVLWAFGANQYLHEYIYVQVVDATASINSFGFNKVSIDITSSDVYCE